jgi:hypothetical protein
MIGQVDETGPGHSDLGECRPCLVPGLIIAASLDCAPGKCLPFGTMHLRVASAGGSDA